MTGLIFGAEAVYLVGLIVFLWRMTRSMGDDRRRWREADLERTRGDRHAELMRTLRDVLSSLQRLERRTDN